MRVLFANHTPLTDAAQVRWLLLPFADSDLVPILHDFLESGRLPSRRDE